MQGDNPFPCAAAEGGFPEGTRKARARRAQGSAQKIRKFRKKFANPLDIRAKVCYNTTVAEA